MPPHPCPDCDQAASLRALIEVGDLDGAIEADLMAFRSCACAGKDAAVVIQAQARLRAAWDARQRYRQRQARLAKRAAERDARRVVAAPVAVHADAVRPALPTGAAAILARAKAKAAERMKP